jgi:hypothetical protein
MGIWESVEYISTYNYIFVTSFVYLHCSAMCSRYVPLSRPSIKLRHSWSEGDERLYIYIYVCVQFCITMSHITIKMNK